MRQLLVRAIHSVVLRGKRQRKTVSPPVYYSVPRGLIMPNPCWRRGVVVSGVRRMNEVNARRVRLVPGWVTVFGRVYHLGM